MTVNDIAQQLLAHFSPEERSIPDAADYPGRNAAVRMAINGALQEVFSAGSPWVRFAERGVLLHAPATIAIAVTHDSTAATISQNDWQPWFGGCMVKINGSVVENRIVSSGSREVTLKFPWDGTSGTVTATVYHTSIDLPADVLEVHAPVKINGVRIDPIAGDILAENYFNDFGSRVSYLDTGSQVRYQVEAWSSSANSAPSFRLAFSHYPSADGFLEYNAMIVPLVVTSIGATASPNLPIPFQWIESVFYPIARKRLSGCDFFRSGSTAQEISDSYQTARSILASLSPRKNSGLTFKPVY